MASVGWLLGKHGDLHSLLLKLIDQSQSVAVLVSVQLVAICLLVEYTTSSLGLDTPT